ncbi:MAG: glycosyltransferase family 39 protein [Rhodospirillales bacterium]|nr:glycosyltransferase family 39 protein [Rhodospirillales bacterium]
MNFLISVAVSGEILWVVLGFYAHFRKDADLNSQAVAYALISMLAVFSLSLFVFFMLGAQEYYFLFDVFLILLATFLIYRNWQTLGQGVTALGVFRKRNPVFSGFVPALAFIPFAKGFLLPPTTFDSLTYHLTRVMMMKAEGQLFLDNFSDYRLDIMTVGYDILHFLFLRFHTDFGLASFGFLSYVLVIVAVYALAHRLWLDEGLAKTLALVTASLTMFVLHAASTKNDLVLGAVAAVVFLSAYNYRQSKSLTDLHVLGIALAFGVTAKFTFGYLGLAFLAGYLVLLAREWGMPETGRQIFRFYRFRGGALLVVPLALTATLVAVLAHNVQTYDHALGPDFFLPTFSGIDGLRGGVANTLRFVVQMMNLPMEFFGLIFTKIHNVILGENYSLGVLWWPDHPVILETSINPPEEAAWFGVLGFPLLLAMIYGAVRGDGFIKAVTLSALLVIVLTAMTTSCTPWRGRYYAGPIIAGLIGLGFWFHRLGLDRPGAAQAIRYGVVAISVANLMYLTVGAAVADFPRIKTLFSDRDSHYVSILGGPEAWRSFIEDTPHGARVLLITGRDVRLFPLYLRRPDLSLTPAGVYHHYFREPLMVDGEAYKIGNPEDFKKLGGKFDRLLMFEVPDDFRAYAVTQMAEMNKAKNPASNPPSP